MKKINRGRESKEGQKERRKELRRKKEVGRGKGDK